MAAQDQFMTHMAEQTQLLRQINTNLELLNRNQEVMLRQLDDLSKGEDNQEVEVADFRMPFSSMVFLLLKASLAAIPAYILFILILGGFGFLLFTLLGGAGGLLNTFLRLGR